MSASPSLRVERVDRRHGPALIDLFERCGSPCFCRYWDFSGDKYQWQDRCANDPSTNRRELLVALGEDSSQAGREPSDQAAPLLGVVALASGDDTCVGWMRLASPARMDKLYEGRLYRGLPCFSGSRQDVLAVACFLVDPDWRRRGVAERLLASGIQVARESGARAVEAFPHRTESAVDEALWLGPFPLYERQGFTVVHDFGPYPVLRREL